MRVRIMRVQMMMAAAAVCGSLIFGQMPPRGGAGGLRPYVLRSGKLVTGAPYLADVNNSSVKSLPDGNTIQRTMTGRLARDSQGRTYSSETMTGLFGQNGSRTITFISDPVAGYSYSLNVETKTATRRAIRTPQSAPEPGGRLQTQNSVALDLGTQVVNGVNAQGKKVTRTVPAGEIGNAQAIVSTHETWYSAELQMVISAKKSDPREGTSAYSLNNIQRIEPPASLFQVPYGYVIKDAPSFERRGSGEIH